MEKDSYKKGLTLVEVLTSLFIIALLSAVAFTINRQTNRQFNLLRSTNKLAQDIRMIQQMAMNTSECPIGTACAGDIPQGYGLCISTETPVRRLNYFLFADMNGDGTYNLEPTDGLVKEGNFEAGVQIKSLNPGPVFDVVFIPPDPTTVIPSDVVSIELENVSGQTKTKTIKINKAGLIWIE